jgi:hypothetical protein
VGILWNYQTIFPKIHMQENENKNLIKDISATVLFERALQLMFVSLFAKVLK